MDKQKEPHKHVNKQQRKVFTKWQMARYFSLFLSNENARACALYKQKNQKTN